MNAKDTIEQAWEQRASLSPGNAPRNVKDAVEEVIAAACSVTLPSGRAGVSSVQRVMSCWPAEAAR